MTYTEVINKVLRRLREATVSGPTDSDYSRLIGEFVNETKREVEDAWKWNALRQQIQVTTSSGTNGYSLTGAGDRFKFVDAKRWAYDQTNFGYVYPRMSKEVKRNLLTDTTTGLPMYYYIEGIDANADPVVYFYSLPGGTYTINFELVVPQAELTDGNTEITVPWYPVMLGTYAKAIAERGEDDGRAHGEALNKYAFALSDAISMDSAFAQGEDEWYTE